ncbi:MAG: biotin--[acetyl-CoA-carboxylase] ligase [Microcella sp.]|uniref:biotin--[acetyl-CoA-carboxylase] ligase n=1 Tax=Microcella sp. TaxID=1913979 RepID=UPI0033154876
MDVSLSRAACDELGATLLWREASASTNLDLVSRVSRASSGSEEEPLADLTVIATDTQTAGRGRLGRAWSTPPGTALAVSVYLAHAPAGGATGGTAGGATGSASGGTAAADPRRLGWVPLLAGVAMVRAVRGLGVAAAGVKWPNDVLVDGRKLCGILTELTPTGVVVGAGLNVTMSAEQLPVPTATSLVIEGADAPPMLDSAVPDSAPLDSALLDRALAAYLRELAALVGRWREAEHPAALRPVVEAHLQTLGLAVRVDLPGQPPVRGTAIGLDDDGRLLVRPAGDDSRATMGVVAVAAGDVTHLRYE